MGTIERYDRWINSPKVSEQDKEMLRQMSQEQIDDAFFKDVEFGTAGMRGILGPGTNRLNEFTVRKATIGFAKYLLEKYGDAKESGVVISHDNRHMSREFTLQSAKVLSEFGIKTYIFDSLRPTPELSFAVRYVHAIGGIMITASHNPKEHNGYKVYDETGCQLVPDKIARLVEIIGELPNELEVSYEPVSNPAQIITLGQDVDDEYVRLCESITLNNDLDKKGFKIVFTPNHGTSYVNAMRVYKDLGYEVYPVLKQCDPDPDFSGTLSPNPEDQRSYIEPIKLAKELKAQLVVMTDPDGDRCGLAFLDKNGEYQTLTGNQSAAMLIDYIFMVRKQRGILHENGVMYNTVVTSSLGEKVAAYYGIKTEQFLTGFKFIGNRIDYYEKLGNGPFFEFGYEESYGCLIAPFARDKDGIQAILMYSEMALYHYRHGKTLDMVWEELGQRFGYHEDKCFSIMFEGSKGASQMKTLMTNLRENPFIEIDGQKPVKVSDYQKSLTVEGDKKEVIDLPKSDVIKLYFADGTTIAVRPSGTEAKVKFYIGVVGSSLADAQAKPNKLYEKLKKTLGI
jgi:phosphoglucomutase